ncbi:mRNA turnover 4, partial [Conglomerata obtusa]
MAVVQKKKNLEIKDKTIKQIQKFALDYPYIILASSKNVRSDFIHDLRSVLSKTSKILFGKKKIMIKALEKQFEKNKEINKFIQKFDNHSFLVFTNDLMTKDILQSKSIRGFLRCGDVCEDEIIIPAGNVTINGNECSSDMDSRLRNCGVPCY